MKIAIGLSMLVFPIIVWTVLRATKGDESEPALKLFGIVFASAFLQLLALCLIWGGYFITTYFIKPL